MREREREWSFVVCDPCSHESSKTKTRKPQKRCNCLVGPENFFLVFLFCCFVPNRLTNVWMNHNATCWGRNPKTVGKNPPLAENKKNEKKTQIVFSLSLRSFCKFRRDNQATSTHPLCFNLEFYLGQILSLCEAKYLVQLLSKTFSYKKGQYLAQINYKNGKEIWNVVDAFFPKENQPQLSECSRCGCEEDVWKNLLSALFSKLEDEKNLLKLRNVCCKKEPRESARSFCSLHVRSRIY